MNLPLPNRKFFSAAFTSPKQWLRALALALDHKGKSYGYSHGDQYNQSTAEFSLTRQPQNSCSAYEAGVDGGARYARTTQPTHPAHLFSRGRHCLGGWSLPSHGSSRSRHDRQGGNDRPHGHTRQQPIAAKDLRASGWLGPGHRYGSPQKGNGR